MGPVAIDVPLILSQSVTGEFNERFASSVEPFVNGFLRSCQMRVAAEHGLEQCALWKLKIDNLSICTKDVENHISDVMISLKIMYVADEDEDTVLQIPNEFIRGMTSAAVASCAVYVRDAIFDA